MDFNFKTKEHWGKNCKKHNQIVHFDNRTKGTYLNVIRVWQDTLIHIITENGKEFLVNPERVLTTEIQWLE